MKYYVHFPPTNQMSVIDYVVTESTMETKEEAALWHYNRSRNHDGLPPLSELPKGVTFTERHENNHFTP
jgi:hypothetical protein